MRRNVESNHRLDKHTLRAIGFALIILGFLLIVVALSSTTITNCPVNGCSPGGSPWMGVFVFFSGIALVITGSILLIIARRMKPEQALKE